MSTFTIDADFPGGNIIIEKIDGETVVLRQDARDTPEWWFYWRFRVRGAGGRTLRFAFHRWRCLRRARSVRQPGRAEVALVGTGDPPRQRLHLRLPAGQGGSVFLLLPPLPGIPPGCFPGRPSAGAGGCPHPLGSKAAPWSISRCIRPTGRGKVLFTARHHACESMANYVLEGLFATWLGHTPEAGFLRNHIDFHAIPFMDKDGVENGDQGKNRSPHDHNRDYTCSPRYAAVRALTEAVDAWRGPLLLHLDLHCPWIRDGLNEEIFAVGAEGTPGEQITALLTLLATLICRRPTTLHARRTTCPSARTGTWKAHTSTDFFPHPRTRSPSISNSPTPAPAVAR